MSDETTGVMTSTGVVYFQKVDYRYQNNLNQISRS